MKRFGHLSVAVRSEIGLKRKNNEDAYGAFPSHGIWCVADGMGGGDDGEIASAAVVQSVESFCKEHPMPPEGAFTAWDVSRGVTAAVNSASSWIFRRAQAKRLKGCGSTFAGVVFDATRPSNALVMHAGDSRVYRIRGKEIRQITKDHSAAELVGVKKESDLNPMFRGMILRAVGIAETVEVDVTPMDVRKGDVVLVCSDGLSRMIPDKKTLSIIRENHDDLNRAADRLIKAVYSAGAVDNVTAVLISVHDLPEAIAEMPSSASFDSSGCEDGHDDPATRDTSMDSSCPDDKTRLTDIVAAFPEAVIPEDESMQCRTARKDVPGAVQSFLGVCRRNPVMTALTAVLVFLAFLCVALAAIFVCRRKDAATSPMHSVTAEVSCVSVDHSVTPATEQKRGLVETGLQSKVVLPASVPVKAAVPSVEMKPEPVKKPADESNDERERRKFADMLRAERAKMLVAEAAEATVAERCHEAAVTLGETCRDRVVFAAFLERMRAAAGSAACANVRMCGQTIASMKPDGNGFSAAACDLVREMQKFAQLMKGKGGHGRIPVRKFARLAAMDPTSREAYELSADIIMSIAGSGGRR